MPNQPKYPLYSVRVPLDDRARAEKRASAEGTALPELVRRFIRDYADSAPHERTHA